MGTCDLSVLSKILLIDDVCSYDEVAKFVPADDLKVLKGIRQSKKRKQKKKSKEGKAEKTDDAGFERAIGGSDSEEEGEADAEEIVMGKKETADGTWIMEVRERYFVAQSCVARRILNVISMGIM